VGRDTGTQVSRLYDGPFPFDGALNRVDITLSDQAATQSSEDAKEAEIEAQED
jgi:hypothetical protein